MFLNRRRKDLIPEGILEIESCRGTEMAGFCRKMAAVQHCTSIFGPAYLLPRRAFSLQSEGDVSRASRRLRDRKARICFFRDQ